MKNEVIVLSPSIYSIYTMCTAEMLIRQGIAVKAVIVVDLINIKRLMGEFKRDRYRLVKKVWNKLILKEKAYNKLQDDIFTLKDLKKQLKITSNNLKDFTNKRNIELVKCKTFNDQIVIDYLEKTSPSAVVFTGGGLIKQNVIEKSGKGILNCHMGILPYYRGMDVIEWPILEKNPDMVGMTVHLMDKGVDTGNVLYRKYIDISEYKTITSIRAKFEPEMCNEIVKTTYNLLINNAKPIKQNLEEGKQYFVMHQSLKRVTNYS